MPTPAITDPGVDAGPAFPRRRSEPDGPWQRAWPAAELGSTAEQFGHQLTTTGVALTA